VRTDAIKELWSDPLLRYSNAFDALFHEHVVVCESDGDCLFYQAVIDAVISREPVKKIPDTLFLHTVERIGWQWCCGRSSRRSFDFCGCGFDVFREERPLRPIVEALGGSWDAIEPLWRAVANSVNQKRADISRVDLKDRIVRILDSSNQPSVTAAEVKDVNAVLRRSSPWQEVKNYGIDFFKGQARLEADKLLDACRALGYILSR